MESNYSSRPTWAEIDLDALLHNLKQATSFCSPQEQILAVVKADAYGHGAVPVTRALQGAGVEIFAVATLEEALELRHAGIDNDLLVLGSCFPGQERAFIEYDLMPTLLDAITAERLQQAAVVSRRKVRVHVKVDSGMGRVGFLAHQLSDFLPRLKEMDGLIVDGFMSHMACADDLDSNITAQQQLGFVNMLDMLRRGGIAPRHVHLNNSAGLSGWGCDQCTLARPGIMLYGGLPGPGFASRLELKPVMHLRSCIAQLRKLKAGSGISYGHSYHAPRDMTVAVLPIGYADGFNRLLSNRAEGLLRGRRVPLVGRVCMDWIMFDVSGVPEAAVGDPVTLMGEAHGQTITGDEVANLLDTISYEVFCRIGSRVPRRYLSEK